MRGRDFPALNPLEMAKPDSYLALHLQVVYLGDTGRLFTTGFSKYNDRQYGAWSQNDLSKPLAMELVDSSSGKRFTAHRNGKT